MASVNVCVMSTFLSFAERAGLAFTSYQCEAGSSGTRCSQATMRQSERTIEKAEANCLISNLMKARMTLNHRLKPHAVASCASLLS